MTLQYRTVYVFSYLHFKIYFSVGDRRIPGLPPELLLYFCVFDEC